MNTTPSFHGVNGPHSFPEGSIVVSPPEEQCYVCGRTANDLDALKQELLSQPLEDCERQEERERSYGPEHSVSRIWWDHHKKRFLTMLERDEMTLEYLPVNVYQIPVPRQPATRYLYLGLNTADRSKFQKDQTVQETDPGGTRLVIDFRAVVDEGITPNEETLALRNFWKAQGLDFKMITPRDRSSTIRKKVDVSLLERYIQHRYYSQVRIRILICPICDSLFREASRASYHTLDRMNDD